MLFDTAEYDQSTLELLSSNLRDDDVLSIFTEVFRFRERGGFKKSYLPDWSVKRRRYDNAFLILEATKFIARSEQGSSTPYIPTIRGNQLALYLINVLGIDGSKFTKLTDEEYSEFLIALKNNKGNE